MAFSAGNCDRLDESPSVPGPSTQHVSKFTGEPAQISDEPVSSTDAWEQRNILTLDGGGTRGVWSLMVLEQLMDYIAVEEMRALGDGKPAEHSFAPEAFPNSVSHGPFNPEEDENDHSTWINSRKYLPCHYFDIIGGSSTGALIAIMLGRYRMTVSDCLDEYRSLAGEIFGNPRHFPIVTTLMTNRTIRAKYNHKVLEKIFKDVENRRERKFDDESSHRDESFKSKKGLCGTFVTSKRMVTSKAANGSKPVILRSYDNIRRNRTSENQSQLNEYNSLPAGRTRSDTTGCRGQAHLQNRTNTLNIAGEATKWPVWKVARAATAAESYFDPLEIDVQGLQVTFTDGGSGQNNNPAREAFEEVEHLYGSAFLGTFVSVGTARGATRSKHKLIAMLKAIIADATDPEHNHHWMENKMEENFADSKDRYFRLNDPGALDIELDDWRPQSHWYRRSDQTPGSHTIEHIEHKFNEWSKNPARGKQFEACAKELVRRRQARTKNDGQWEYFATGIKIRCSAERCLGTFRNRDDFKRHFQDMHLTGQNISEETLKQILREKGKITKWCYQQRR